MLQHKSATLRSDPTPAAAYTMNGEFCILTVSLFIGKLKREKPREFEGSALKPYDASLSPKNIII